MTDTLMSWTKAAAALSPRSKLFVDDAFVDAASGESFSLVSPADGSHRLDVAAAGPADVDRAVSAARRVFDSGVWSTASPRERKAKLLALADLYERDANELALLITLDMGKPIRDAVGEVAGSLRCLRYYAEAVDKVYGEVVPMERTDLAMVTREPIGVVAAVIPWNYPLLMMMWKVAPALASGNSVVLKPAEQSPLAALKFAELVTEAGIPAGVFGVLPGLGAVTGQALGLHMDVDKVTFTGSTATGRQFLRYAADSNLKSVTLECGGKSPAIVLADAPDLQVAARVSAEGIFGNAGQVCNAGSRLLVQRSIRDTFVSELLSAAADWCPGDPLDPAVPMGPLVSDAQLKRVLSYLDSAREEGATVATGGNRVRTETGGFYAAPTVLTDVSNGMRVAQEEIFGPVVTVIEFEDEHEAVLLANDSEYGLAAGVWTNDLTKAHTIARALRAGSVYVNCWGVGDNSMPFGGYKQSGIGRDKSLHAFDNYTELKATFFHLGS